MRNWHNEDFMEVIEALADERGYLSSEEELSERFDSEVAPSVIAHHGENDIVALNEAFNDWTDGLFKDGDIHPLQYDQYSYVGEYSE